MVLVVMIAARVPADRLHVVHLCANLREGGAEALVRALAPRLIDEGIAVTLVSIYGSRLTDRDRAEIGVPVIEIGRKKRGDYGYWPRLVSTLRALRPDVLHTHLHTGKYAGRTAAIAAGVPAIVFTEHGDEAGGIVRAAINRVLHPLTSRFVVFTESQRRAYSAGEGVPLERICVIPNGISASADLADRRTLRDELGLAPDDFALFLPARLAAQKNQRLAIAALAKANAPRLHLLLAGDGPDAAMLRAYAEERGCSERVHFLGYRTDVRRIAGAMDAYIIASTWERMPLALGEAMMDGLPAISTPWEGARDFITDGETGYLAADFTAEALANSFVRAANDDALRARIRSNARRYAAARFDIRRTARAHAELYRELVR